MLEDGIYFGLPEADHHADPALGSSDHKALLISPPRWWLASAHAAEFRGNIELELNPEESAAKTFGRAAHVLTLEGEETFRARYWCEEDPPPGTLCTKEDIADAYLEKTGRRLFRGLSFTDMETEARIAGITGLLSQWKADKLLENAGKEELSRSWMTTLRLLELMLNVSRESFGGKSIRERFLTGGVPEVTVIVTLDDGVRIKGRFDYLRIKALIDVKTFMARDDEETIAAFGRSISNFGYDLQAALYLELREHIPRLVEEGRVFGDHDPEWLAKVAAHREVTWAWVALQTAGMPEADALEFQGSLILASAKYQLEAARKNFVAYRDKYGLAGPWVADRGLIKLDDTTFEAMGLARRMTGRGEETWTLI